MPVTEIATLQLVPPHAWSFPETQSFFAAVASQQAAWSGCPLHYFQDTSDAAVVYILTGWESVAAHEEWIRSEENQRLLEHGKGLIEVVGLQHARFAAELEGVGFVVLERWDGDENAGEQEEGAIVDVTGSVEEKPEQVIRLKGFAEERACEGDGRAKEKPSCLRRLTVYDGVEGAAA